MSLEPILFASAEEPEDSPKSATKFGNPAAIAEWMKNKGYKGHENESLVRKLYRKLEEARAQYKVQGKKSQVEQPGKVDRAKRMQDDPTVTENHKVQNRSYKTVNDMDNDPTNVRDPEIPQA